MHFKYNFYKNENFEFIVGFLCCCESAFWPWIIQFWIFRIRTGLPGLTVFLLRPSASERWSPLNPGVESIDTSPHNNGTTFNSNFGINYVDCASSYFRPGAYWPLQNAANAGTTVRLCNNVFGKQHYYATLFSVTDRIPVYSGMNSYHRSIRYSTPLAGTVTWRG